MEKNNEQKLIDRYNKELLGRKFKLKNINQDIIYLILDLVLDKKIPGCYIDEDEPNYKMYWDIPNMLSNIEKGWWILLPEDEEVKHTQVFIDGPPRRSKVIDYKSTEPATTKVLMPKELTAENGAKALMSAEFYEEYVTLDE